MTTIEQAGAVADRLDSGGRVRHEQDRLALRLERLQRAHALLLEVVVADGEDLVEQQDVGLEVGRNREAEPHVHARTSSS